VPALSAKNSSLRSETVLFGLREPLLRPLGFAHFKFYIVILIFDFYILNLRPDERGEEGL
jgi:hypothetical protein